jgi:hypothetical protein
MHSPAQARAVKELKDQSYHGYILRSNMDAPAIRGVAHYLPDGLCEKWRPNIENCLGHRQRQLELQGRGYLVRLPALPLCKERKV